MLNSRLSVAVAFAPNSPALTTFLGTPGTCYAEASFKFHADCASDVFACIDQEWLEGTTAYINYSGADWMSFVAVQRDGSVWVAVGTAATHAGTPSTVRTWQIESLGVTLAVDTWYTVRVTSNFSTRYFTSVRVTGPSLDTTFDLSAHRLDYPNYMPFDNAAMTFYAGAMRILTEQVTQGTPLVYWDNFVGQAASLLFSDGFDRTMSIPAQPTPGNPIVLANYDRSRWYKERAEALISTERVSCSSRRLVANVDLNE